MKKRLTDRERGRGGESESKAMPWLNPVNGKLIQSSESWKAAGDSTDVWTQNLCVRLAGAGNRFRCVDLFAQNLRSWDFLQHLGPEDDPSSGDGWKLCDFGAQYARLGLGGIWGHTLADASPGQLPWPRATGFGHFAPVGTSEDAMGGRELKPSNVVHLPLCGPPTPFILLLPPLFCTPISPLHPLAASPAQRWLASKRQSWLAY